MLEAGLRARVEAFAASGEGGAPAADGTPELALEPTLSSFERMRCHAICEELGLGHESRGAGPARRIHVWRPAAAAAPPGETALLNKGSKLLAKAKGKAKAKGPAAAKGLAAKLLGAGAGVAGGGERGAAMLAEQFLARLSAAVEKVNCHTWRVNCHAQRVSCRT